MWLDGPAGEFVKYSVVVGSALIFPLECKLKKRLVGKVRGLFVVYRYRSLNVASHKGFTMMTFVIAPVPENNETESTRRRIGPGGRIK